MKRISRLLPRSVFARFSTAFLLFGLLPLLVIMLFSLSRFSATMEEDTISRTRQMVSLVASNFETSFQRLASITEKMYLYDSENYGRLPDILLRNEDPSAIMRDYVEMLCDSYDTLCNVIFYDLVNDAVYAAGYPSTKALEQDYDFSKCDYVKKALANPRDLTISSPHAEDYYIFSDATVITLCRSLLSLDDLPERERILGILMLDIDYQMFDAAFGNYTWSDFGRLDVVDENGLIIYSDQEASIGQTLDDTAADAQNVLIEEKVASAGWDIRYDLDRGAISRRIRLLRRYVLLLGAITTAVILLLAPLFTRRLTQPIKQMLRKMKVVRGGDLSVRVEVRGDDEMSELSRGFNRMVADLDSYVKRSYVARLKQNEAELNELKMQIHPHFLYNTLEVIRMSAVEHNDPESAAMIMALVKQLQYVIGEVRECVSLDAELTMIRDYISLINLRYGNIELALDIPSKLTECRVLKLCLQPIVENAVQHGLRPQGGGLIRISAQAEGEVLQLTVMDSGQGMTPEALAGLRASLASDAPDSMPSPETLQSIGLKNVQERIHLSYGTEYGLQVESREGVGTAVELRLPYRLKEGSE